MDEKDLAAMMKNNPDLGIDASATAVRDEPRPIYEVYETEEIKMFLPNPHELAGRLIPRYQPIDDDEIWNGRELEPGEVVFDGLADLLTDENITAVDSHLEADLLRQIYLAQLTDPETQYRFAAYHVGMGPGIRKRLKDANLKDWRFDFAWVEERLAVEVEGGTWVRGRHSRGKGFEDDCHKYNTATLMGWRVLRFTGGMVQDGTAVAVIMQALD